MSETPKVLIFFAAGFNTEAETKDCFERAGAEVDVVHINAIVKAPEQLKQYDILVVPGGFSYGDDIGSGVVFANQLRTLLRKQIETFLDNGGLMLGVCNGFQVIMKAGLLTSPDGHFEERPSATLTWNQSARYEDRWVRLKVTGGRTPWLPDDGGIECPVRHAEGRFVPRDAATLKRLRDNGQLVLHYADERWQPATRFPENPNGSEEAVAGICSASGQVLGLMPHAECHTYYWHHPHWTRDNTQTLRDTNGLKLFQAGVNGAKQRLAKL